MDISSLIIVGVIASVLGFIIAKLIDRSSILKWQTTSSHFEKLYTESLQREEKVKAEYLKVNEKLQAELKSEVSERYQIQNKFTQKETELEGLQRQWTEQKAEMQALQKKFSEEFENLAQRILEQKSEKFTQENKRNITHILEPLKERLQSFETKIEKTNTDFLQGHSQLGEQLKHLNEQNLRISEEANNLTKALKGDNKTQGNWGEMILEKVLQKSGLVRGREYEIQQHYKDDNGVSKLPDVVVYLPNEKLMVIDSKVSLKAYENYINTENEHEKQTYLKAHVKSLESHLKGLKEKRYDLLGGESSPDFILMFIPVEPALFLAQSENSNFFYSAFQDNILMVSPTTLLSTLRTVDMVWSNEKQQQNALEIAKHAGDLYDKFVNLIEGLDAVGNRIDSTKATFDQAMKKLTGQQNLIKDVEALKNLGVTSKKTIDPKWITNP
ncbi:DNA recombination protein RmuC [Psychroflexus sp. YR1-1]|uniref:DNA recombination protein RmuC n=1 Tax=Psychroflexus aurantiacus TaxID=2709310 RepID=A0A6B3R9R5_9FLAO|nr:DNA recombination protein RmuC [Psychroflexus aurantiacus]NEV94304.1 DNA recombination protein RmuC [Psychroflexus aurantiacus]